MRVLWKDMTSCMQFQQAVSGIKGRKGEPVEQTEEARDLQVTWNIDAEPEPSPNPQIQLHQKYWVTEESKAKLLAVGAKCLEFIPETVDYYDTALDELAAAQLWLSKRNQQWCLILESRKQPAEKNAAGSVPEIREPLCQGRTENTATCRSSRERKPAEMACFNERNQQQQNLEEKEEEKANVCATPNSSYAELLEESEIIASLAKVLHIDLKTETERNESMEDFLQKAGIQHYASNHTVRQGKYMLGNRYTIIIQRTESACKETATVLLDVDISDICQGLEEMEKLANYLGFVQSEGGLTMEHIQNRPYGHAPFQFP
ncbi:hypothetical protein JRQ81_008525 [Phrynocephalus forsythii]|uniref:Uncharacterized protein n=1 Tax=Phrynocephalus forsythii TaxID=171643 RepID=A0A9Q0XA92_9SAUR|nr:hypothetical protein JRQ81_008525 [Phrynocephalus forsythii]